MLIYILSVLSLSAGAQLKDIRILVPRDIPYSYYDLMQFLPGERHFVLASGGLSVYNTETAEIVDEAPLSFSAKSLSIHQEGSLIAVAVGNELIFYSFTDHRLKELWRTGSAELIKAAQGADYYSAMPVGSAFFTGKDKEMHVTVGAFTFIYDAEQRKVVRSHTLESHAYILHSAISAKGTEAVMAVSNGSVSNLVLQSLTEPARTSTLMNCKGAVTKMYSRGDYLFCFGSGNYFVMNLKSGQIVHEVRMPQYDLSHIRDAKTEKQLNQRVALSRFDTANFAKDEYVYDIDLLSSKGQLVYATSKGIKFIDLKTRKLLRHEKHSGTNLRISFGGNRLLFNSYTPYKALRIYDPGPMKLISERVSMGYPVYAADISPDKRWLYTSGGSSGFLWDLNRLSKYAEIRDPSNSDTSYVMNVFFLNDSEVVVNSGSSYRKLNLWIYDIKRKAFKRSIRKNVQSISSGFMNGEFYYCDYNSLHIINLNTLHEEKYEGMYSLAASPLYQIVSFTRDLVFVPENLKYRIVNRKTRKTEFESESWSVNARVMIHPDNQSVLAFSQIKKKKNFSGYEAEVPVNALVKIDLKKKEVVKDYAETYFPYDFKVKNGGRTLGVWYLNSAPQDPAMKEAVYSEYDMESGKEHFTRSLASTTNIVTYHFTSDGGKYFVLAEPMGGFFKIYDESGEIMSLEQLNIQLPRCFLAENSDLMIITSMVNSQATFVDLKARKVMGDLVNAPGDNFFMITPELNYIGSKEFVKALRFKSGAEIFSFDQFDVYLNQPHKVLQAFHCRDSALIRAYESAYLKRLKVLGIRDGSKADFSKLPSISTAQATELRPGMVSFAISANKGKAPLKQIEIHNNGNLVRRVDIAAGASSRFEGNFEFETSSGMNRFEFVAKDEAGLESQHITRFYNNTNVVKPDLYLVVIASEKFSNSDFNLAYAVKDAGDVAATLSNSKAFGKVHTRKLYNESFSSDSVRALRQFFEKANINDVVVVFFAGHGYLDEDFSYYFPTYYTDFSDPKVNSVAYQNFEALFAGMKPTRKLMFIDACFSGEADSEAEAGGADAEPGGRDSSRSVRVAESGFARATALELSKAVFSDLRQSSGATIISSAGGTEAAFEGAKWNNGLFTHCLIKGLKSLKADLNKDQRIMLSELQKYVSEEVYRLSEGRQTPTYRVENIVLDYELW